MKIDKQVLQLELNYKRVQSQREKEMLTTGYVHLFHEQFTNTAFKKKNTYINIICINNRSHFNTQQRRGLHFSPFTPDSAKTKIINFPK